MTCNRSTAIAEVKAELIEARDACQQRLNAMCNVILGNGYIVMCGSIALTFDVSPDKVATNPKSISIASAPLFSERDAMMLAEQVKNGHGEPGRVMHINDALRANIIELNDVIASLPVL